MGSTLLPDPTQSPSSLMGTLGQIIPISPFSRQGPGSQAYTSPPHGYQESTVTTTVERWEEFGGMEAVASNAFSVCKEITSSRCYPALEHAEADGNMAEDKQSWARRDTQSLHCRANQTGDVRVCFWDAPTLQHPFFPRWAEHCGAGWVRMRREALQHPEGETAPDIWKGSLKASRSHSYKEEALHEALVHFLQ